MTTLGRNVGDEFIRHGIRTILDAAGVSYDPFYVCKHDLTTLFRPVEDERYSIPDKFWDCDLFIQSGAPVWWRNRDGTSSLTTPWFKYLWEDRILTGRRRVWNLGAGSCQAWREEQSAFSSDGACLNFSRQALESCEITTTRDRVAFEILEGKAPILACPAFLAALGWRQVRERKGLIGINLMSLGCHHDLAGDFSPMNWAKRADALVRGLRLRGQLIFIAHDPEEVRFMQQFTAPGERVFWSPSWRDYMDVYGSCSSVVANRIHGAVCAAGFGRPAVILGNDTRAFIGSPCGLMVMKSDSFDLDAVFAGITKPPVDPRVVLRSYVNLIKPHLS